MLLLLSLLQQLVSYLHINLSFINILTNFIQILSLLPHQLFNFLHDLQVLLDLMCDLFDLIRRYLQLRFMHLIHHHTQYH